MAISAPTSSRHWLRRRNVLLITAVGLGIAVGWIVLEIVTLWNAAPVIAVDYRTKVRRASMSVAAVSLDEGQRSWAAMQNAVGIAADVTREMKDERQGAGVDFERVRFGSTPLLDAGVERDALDLLRQRGFFDALQAFEKMPPGLGPVGYPGSIFEEPLPEIGDSRKAARAIAAAMRIEAINGNLDDVVGYFAGGLALAETASLHRTVISGLVAVAIDRLLFAELRSLLMEYRFTASQCAALLDSMDRHALAGLAHSVQSERSTLHDAIQWAYTDDGNGDGYLLPSAIDDLQRISASPIGGQVKPRPSLTMVLTSRFALARRIETAAKCDEYFDRLLKEIALPPDERWRGGFDPESFVSTLPKSHSFLKLIMPALHRAVSAWEVHDVERESTRLMIAIAWHRETHGQYPSSLGALAPSMLAEVPLDPLQGQSFGFRLITDDAVARPYLLYSIGFDGMDHAGQEPSGHDQAAAIRDRASHDVDYVLNPPRASNPPE